MEVSCVASDRYALPLPESASMYSPPGVASIESAGPPATDAGITDVADRGIAVLPITCHTPPFDIRNCKPESPIAIARTYVGLAAPLRGMGGNATLPITCLRLRSTMLMDSPPVFAT